MTVASDPQAVTSPAVSRPAPAGPWAWLDRALEWVVRLVWLNFWWTLLTLLGGVVLGALPATVGAYAVARAWQRDEDVSVPGTMWRHWREEVGRRAAISAVTTALLAALLTTLMLSRQQPPMLAAVSQGLGWLGVILLAATLPHLTWVCARHRMSVSRTFLAALSAGISRPILTLTLLALAIGWPALLISSGWPGLLPVCAASVPIVTATWCVQRVFPDSHPQATTTNATERTDHHDHAHP